MDTALNDRLAAIEARLEEQMGWIHGQHRVNQVLIGALLESGALPLAEIKRHLELAHDQLNSASEPERVAVQFWRIYLDQHVIHGQRRVADLSAAQ